MMKTLFSTIFAILFSTSAITLSTFAQEVPKAVDVGIVNGKATSLPKPEYPQHLRDAGIEGMISVNVVIDETGTVTFAEADLLDRRPNKTAVSEVYDMVVADAELRAAAENAARMAKFSPTMIKNIPVQVTGKLYYTFVAGPKQSDPSIKIISGVVLNGKATSLPLPDYPAAAKAVKASGTVSVQIVIDENGNVAFATAVSGHPLLRSASEAAAKEAKFSPTLMNNEVTKVSGILTYNFVP